MSSSTTLTRFLGGSTLSPKKLALIVLSFLLFILFISQLRLDLDFYLPYSQHHSHSQGDNTPWHRLDLQQLPSHCPHEGGGEGTTTPPTRIVVLGSNPKALETLSISLRKGGYPVVDWPSIPSGTIDSLRNSIHSVDYDLASLSPDLQSSLRRPFEGLQTGIMLSTEAALLLPILTSQDPTLKVIHLVSDVREEGGVEWDLARLVDRPLQVEKAGEEELARAKAWASVNLGIKEWAREKWSCDYHPFRLEDLCHSNSHQAKTSSEDLLKILHLLHPNGNALTLDCSTLSPSSPSSPAITNSLTRLLGPLPHVFGYPRYPPLRYDDPLSHRLLHLLGKSSKKLTLITLGGGSNAELFNWLLHYSLTSAPSMSPILIATPDEALQVSLSKRGFPAIFIPKRAEGRNEYWLWRLSVLDDLVSRGYEVLLSDLDAVWSSNAWKLLPLAGEVDAIGSRGLATHMRAGANDFTASFCMGLAWFASTSMGRSVLHNARLMAERVSQPDDQVAINAIFARYFDTRWSHSEVYDPEWAYGESALYPPLKVAMIPHQFVLRECGVDRKEAVVMHCYHPGEAKEVTLRTTGMWKLGTKWEKWWDALGERSDEGSGDKWVELIGGAAL